MVILIMINYNHYLILMPFVVRLFEYILLDLLLLGSMWQLLFPSPLFNNTHIFRFYSVSHRALKDTVIPLQFPIKSKDGLSDIDEVFVPKGTEIYISILGANRSKMIWGEDAEEWKPSRWLGSLPSSVSEAHLPGVYSQMWVISWLLCFKIINIICQGWRSLEEVDHACKSDTITIGLASWVEYIYPSFAQWFQARWKGNKWVLSLRHDRNYIRACFRTGYFCPHWGLCIRACRRCELGYGSCVYPPDQGLYRYHTLSPFESNPGFKPRVVAKW